MSGSRRKPQRIYLVTLILWGVLSLADYIHYVYKMLSEGYSAELYANSIGFQTIAYALTRFPYWLTALLLILIAEIVVFGRRSRDVVEKEGWNACDRARNITPQPPTDSLRRRPDS